jgi:hypothetical protein
MKDETTIVKVIRNNIEDFEEMTNTKLTEEQIVMFVLGFSSGLTQLKNYPDYNNGDILDLWQGLRKSNYINDKIKNWLDARS